MNGVSSFLDGSQLYGSSLTEINAIRTFSNGKIQITECLRYETALFQIYDWEI